MTNIVIRDNGFGYAWIHKGPTPLAGTSEQEDMNKEIINAIKAKSLWTLFH